MTQEEKSKAYDKLIKRLKDFQSEYKFETIDRYFPELKEDEDEKIRKWLIALIKSNEYGSISNVGEMPYPKLNVLAWLEKQAQKHAWSERDEKLLNDAISLADECDDIELRDWLKSIKDRQPKVELTQLDKNILEAAIAFIEQNNHFNCWRGVDKHTVLSTLYSLKSQEWWKPTEVQITCLQDAINDYHHRGYKAETLGTLLKQLKQF